jgi:hypothetical protein
VSVVIWVQGLETWGHELYRFPLMPQVRGHEWGTQCVGHPPGAVVVRAFSLPHPRAKCERVNGAPGGLWWVGHPPTADLCGV